MKPNEEIEKPLEPVSSDTGETFIPEGKVPDFRSLGRHQEGFATEIGSSDADKIKQAIEAAQKKPLEADVQPMKRTASYIKRKQPVVHTIGGYRVSKPLPDTSRIGWTAFSNALNPGGSLNILAIEKNKGKTETERAFHVLTSPPYGGHWQDFGIIFVIGIGFWLIVQLGAGTGIFIFCLFFVGSYYRLSSDRFKTCTKDDIKREFAQLDLASCEFENVTWLNTFIQKFWLIFEPVLSAYVIENIDTYLVDYLPGFLDSVRLTTFTLGSKSFCVEHVKCFPDTERDTVCMDWSVSFVPNDTFGMTREQIDKKVNPKVVLNIRLGKGLMGTAFPVLVEDMSFSGRIRIKLQFISKMPHIKIASACFMEKPTFDYVLKPLGGETFGFDVNNIPGLQGFVRDQAHAILGPMLYYPNVFSFDIEKFFSGELDINRANGVLAVTIHSSTKIKSSDAQLNPFIRFYLDAAQELEKTSICENTMTPHWNETKFLLLNNLESILNMELRTTNNTKKAGKKLAIAQFDLKDIKHKQDNELDNLTLPMLRHGKQISNLKVDMRYFPVSKPIQHEDGTFTEAESSNSGIVRVTIHECKYLGTNKVNPYATIKINGVDRFKTPTFKRTSNPKFERSYEILVLDKTEVFIRVSVIDSIDFAENTSLGSWDASLVDIMRDQEDREYWWNLRKRGQEIQARLRFSVQWKPVVMSGLASMGGVGIYKPPVGVIRFSIWSAEDITTKSLDTFVRIKSGNQTRAKTEIIDNTTNPEWGEHHYVPIHSIHESLVLEVMQWSANSKDKLIGSTVLEMNNVIRENKTGNTVWYEAIQEKLDRQVPLHHGNTQKGFLIYTAEFYPTMALPEKSTEEEDEDEEQTKEPLPLVDLHGLPIRYTPDDLIDLYSYGSGVLTVKVHEVKANIVYECYCRTMVDSLTAQHKTETLKGRTLAFNSTTDAFVKDAGFSRVAIELKPADTTEKDDHKVAYWYESTERIIRQIQRRARQKHIQGALVDLSEMCRFSDDDEGEWYNLLQPVGGEAQIRLSFGYSPLLSFTIDPNESLENQGILTVSLLHAKGLRAADKSGTSDPYVKFIIDGDVVHKSSVIKKTCNPVWKDETMQVPIVSRVTASFRIEVFDWNQIAGDVPLGSGGITIRGDMVESFCAHDIDIPLDGQAGDTGTVRVRLKWEPQLLLRRKTQKTFMGTTRRVTTKMGTTAFNFAEPPKNTSTSSSLSNLVQSNSSLSAVENKLASVEENSVFDGTLHVHIIQARQLTGEHAEKMNPQAIVSLGGHQLLKTKKIKKTTFPTWNESIVYTIHQQHDLMLGIKLKDAHTFSSSDLGSWTGSLSTLIRPNTVASFDDWLSLEPRGTGEIHVKLDFVPK
ncbi:C2 domain-containing protein [Gilbertella persicaria]|uniref:C2 domain-containing protein n=1 Tax=Gilbertella persicaria TaxID=101096 RepID=UPI00221F3315|nr:C2 domain-containing protein [Gilbertella persicaria]KAI8083251.1 C2 domain-containing protein [Gilbertella persicaria]